MNPSIEVKLRGRKFRIEAHKDSNGEYSWTAYRQVGDEVWDKIPCMSRSEENSFPSDVAWCATAFVGGLNFKQTAEGVKP